MNLFRLHDDPIIAARMNCNRHSTKMPIEGAQLLCEAYWARGEWAPYRTPSIRNNPICRWVRHNAANYAWALTHSMWLSVEYSRRYGRMHGTHAVLTWLWDHPLVLPPGPETPFPPSVPTECKVGTVVDMYRTYYLEEKRRFARWPVGEMPSWYAAGLLLYDPGDCTYYS